MRTQWGDGTNDDPTDPIELYRCRVAQASEIAKRAAEQSSTARKALADFSRFIGSDPVARLRECATQRTQLAATISKAEAELAGALSQLNQAEAVLSSAFNVVKWFNEADKQKKAVAKTLKVKAEAVAIRLADLGRKKGEADQAEAVLEADIERYRHESLVTLRNAVDQATVRQGECYAEARGAEKALRAIEARCAPLVERHRALKLDQRQRAALVAEAERLDERLSNDRENARYWHQQAQVLLGNSSPGYYLRDARRDLRAVERDLEKLTRRLSDEVRLANRSIEMLVVDGLNLCYDDQRFVGLAPVMALAAELALRHQVVVYFDSDVRSRLGLNDRAIAQQFDRRVQVTVTPTGTKADRLLLEYAGNRPGCFVISNDRFADYPDMMAVAQQRLILHSVQMVGSLSLTFR